MDTAEELKDALPFIKAKSKIQKSLNKLGMAVDWMIHPPKVYKLHDITEDTPSQRIKLLRSYERLLLSNRLKCRTQERWFIDWQLQECQKEYLALVKKQQWERACAKAAKEGHPLPQNSQIPLDLIRAIPISAILNITPQTAIKCLFHEEKTASMRLHPKKNYVHCFGCNKTASIIDIYMVQKQCSVAEAIKDLSKLI